LFKNFQWCSDFEGVHDFNDMAAELAGVFHPDGQKAGERFFANVSKIDNWWALTKKDYRAGTTLVLILPFLKIWGVTDAMMRDYAVKNLRLIPGAKETLTSMARLMPTSIISTTYSTCILPVGKIVGIPKQNIFCTQVSLDSYQLSSVEIRRIERFEKEISAMPILDWPEGARAENRLSDEMQRLVYRFNQIFWREEGLMGVRAYQRMIKEIKVIGGPGKAEAIQQSCRITGVPPEGTIYTGDSITDKEAFQLVNQGGGLTIAVNGNRYAVEKADVACLIEHTSALEILILAFAQGGHTLVNSIVQKWNWETMRRLERKDLFREPIKRLRTAYPKDLPLVAMVTEQNLSSLIKQSEAFRKQVRGKVIGSLG
jgi:energy-converting hydrogenase A subunit R